MLDEALQLYVVMHFQYHPNDLYRLHTRLATVIVTKLMSWEETTADAPYTTQLKTMDCWYCRYIFRAESDVNLIGLSTLVFCKPSSKLQAFPVVCGFQAVC